MPELSTLGSTIKVAYEGQPDTNAFTDAEKTKLAGIDDESTKNAPDAYLTDRANHTGVQSAATIIDLPDLMATKVDAVPGKGLSDENFTAALRSKVESHEDPNFKGVFLSLAALEDAFPNGAPGQYATVDDGVTVQWYAWNSGSWEPRVGESTELTPQQVGQYYESLDDRNPFRDSYKEQLDALENRFAWRRSGTWNASTNSPALQNGDGQDGNFYQVTVAGTHDFGVQPLQFNVGDLVAYFGGTWNRILASSPAPAWGDVTGKPNFATLYQPKQRGAIGPVIPALNRFLLSSSHTGTEQFRLSTWGTVYGYDQFGLLAPNGQISIPVWATHARISAYVVPVQSGVELEVEIRRGTRYGGGTGGNVAITPIMKVSSTDIFEVIVRITSGAAATFNTASWLCVELYE